MPFMPFLTQVPPLRIDENNQVYLLAAQPAFNLLLAFDRIADVFKALEIQEPIEPVLPREIRSISALVFPHPPQQITGQARVERLRSLRHDVNEICPCRTGLHRSFATLRMTNAGTV